MIDSKTLHIKVRDEKVKDKSASTVYVMVLVAKAKVDLGIVKVVN